MKKFKSQIRQLIKMRLDNTNLAIYPDVIACWLDCPLKLVEDELFRLEEEGIIRKVYEMRCVECDSVIATSEAPFDIGQTECFGCGWQPEAPSMNPVVTAYIRIENDDVFSFADSIYGNN